MEHRLMAPQPDYSRAALARFIEFVVAKGLVHPATAQGWRVATAKVLEELSAEEVADVRRIEVERTFKDFLNRYPGRLSPASVGEYRRRVGRAIEEFIRWMEDPGSYAFRPSARIQKEGRRQSGRGRTERSTEEAASPAPAAVAGGQPADSGVSASGPAQPGPGALHGPRSGITFDYPLRPDLLAQVLVPRDLTVEEARRMGAFLVTLAVDFRPAASDR
jgi:hypothetical protein